MLNSPNTKALKNVLSPWLSGGYSLWQPQYFLFSASSPSHTTLTTRQPCRETSFHHSGLPWARRTAGTAGGRFVLPAPAAGTGLGSHTGCFQMAKGHWHELDLSWLLEIKKLSCLLPVFGFSSSASSLAVDVFQHALINSPSSSQGWQCPNA